jgi:uncharacterized membrane protein
MSNGRMSRARMAAFSDGVIAIIVTVMVLQLTHPAETTLASLLKPGKRDYFLYTVGRGPFSSVSRSQIMSSRE